MLLAALLAGHFSHSPPQFAEPGTAKVYLNGEKFRLKNNAVDASWDFRSGQLRNVNVTSVWTGNGTYGDFIDVWIGDERIPGQSLILKRGPKVEKVTPDLSSPKLADHFAGIRVKAVFTDPKGRFELAWASELRDGSNYIREEAELSSLGESVAVTRIADFEHPKDMSRQVGDVQGSPMVDFLPDRPEIKNAFFWACEHPMARNAAVDPNGIEVGLDRKSPIRKGVPWKVSFVYGVTDWVNPRRDFLRYIERERARPYKPFLHFNSWYSLGYFTPFDEKQCTDTIALYGEELYKKRGVKLDSFLFDDGWDDTSTVWEFHKGFPNGFAPLKAEAGKFGAGPGVWLSPWGGYGGPRDKRLAAGKAAGMEIDSQGYALSGPNYFKRFREVCLRMVSEYGINQFKFDGTGSPDKHYPGSAFDSDFAAAIQLIHDLRAAKPDLFVNLTTGTWPSPFWLMYADSIWRGGSDHSFSGVGSPRQQWITYRDGDTFRGVVERGPLYPINSLMVHGLLYAHGAKPLDTDPNNEFKDEVHSYFACGTQLQEMYVDPKLLSSDQWDWIAEAAKWSKANADVLQDVHWIGGDPNNLEVYGWAAWAPRKGIVTLRNPSDKPQAYALDVRTALELFSDKGSFGARSVWDKKAWPRDFVVGKRQVITLKPFEVLTLEFEPK